MTRRAGARQGGLGPSTSHRASGERSTTAGVFPSTSNAVPEMTRDLADSLSQQLEDAGFAHTHTVDGAGGHQLILTGSSFDASQLRTLFETVLPTGAAARLEGTCTIE